MAYADFTYYQSEFYGNIISEESTFRTFSERASEYMDTITFDRITDDILEMFENKIQKCCCALAELFFKRNIATVNAVTTPEELPLSSENIGSYSVSTANPYDYIQEVSLDDREFFKSVKRTALKYLGNTDLMYRGID